MPSARTRGVQEFRSYIGSGGGKSSGIMDSGKWGNQEDVTMKQAVSVFGPNWHLIARNVELQSKSEDAVQLLSAPKPLAKTPIYKHLEK